MSMPSSQDDTPSTPPYVIGVIGDFLGDTPAPRRYVEISAETLEAVLRLLGPTLSLTIDNLLQNDDSAIRLTLRFAALDDFTPAGLGRQIGPLAAALGLRAQPTASPFEQLLRAPGNAAPQQDDAGLARQIDGVRGDPAFRRLEAGWRGLQLLAQRVAGMAALSLQIIPIAEPALAKALSADPETLFASLFDPDDAPAPDLLIADLEFSHAAQSVESLGSLANLAADASVPVLAGVSPYLFGVDRMTALEELGDNELRRRFERPDFAKWRGLRERDAARYVTLVMPRVEAGTVSINGAYLLGARIAECVAATGWGLALEGSVGRFEPEIEIAGEREALLSRLGLACLARTDASAELRFLGVPTFQKSREYDDPAITRHVAIAAQLPAMLAITHSIQVLTMLAGEAFETGSSLDACAARLNAWLGQFVGPEADLASTGDPARPFREAQVTLVPADRSARAQARIWADLRLWPRLPRQALAAPIKLRIPLA